jgi:hypothetical protein
MSRSFFLFAIASLSFTAQAQDGAPPPPPEKLPARDAYEVPQQRIAPGETRRPKPEYKPERDEEGPRGPKGKGQAQWQAALEQNVRDAISANGFTDVTLQNIILEHIQSESRARAPLRERGRRLFRGLSSPKVGDAEMSLALGGYIAAIEADRTRRAAAEAELDAKIGWSKNPRLHSMLLLFGIIGESPITLPIRAFNQPPRALPRPGEMERKDKPEPPGYNVPAPPAEAPHRRAPDGPPQDEAPLPEDD